MKSWGKDIEEVLNQFEDHTCLIDDEGEIILVNKAWKAFADENGGSQMTWEGLNYLNANKQGDEEVNQFIAGVKNVLNGKQKSAEFIYPCHSPTEKRWFKATARPLRLKGKKHAIIIHQNESVEGSYLAEKISLDKRLKAEQERLTKIFQEAPISMAIVKGENHVFQAANEAYYRLTNRQPDIMGKNVREVFPELEGHGYLDWLNDVYNTGKTFSGNETLFYFYPKDSDQLEERYLNFVYQPYRNEEGEIEGIFYTGVDVTEQVVARKKIESSESRLSTIFENSKDNILLWKVKKNGYSIEEINSNAMGLFNLGASKEKLIGMSGETFFKKISKWDVDQRQWQDRLKLFHSVRSSKESVAVNQEIDRESGSVIYEESIIPIINEKEVTHILVIARDITNVINHQRLLEAAEENTRRFASELNRILEEERAHWAREIHDEFGQQLSGIKMSLSTLSHINFEPEKSQAIIFDVTKSLEDASKSLKTFSTQLRPGILDSLGISEALEWLVDEFVKKSDIEVKKNIDKSDVTIDKELSNNIFRICQESMNNIAKHAGATSVEIAFDIDEKEIVLSITDNGVGIKQEKLQDPFSMGLLGMKERSRLTGALLEIDSEEGEYTKITFHQQLKTNGKRD